MKLYFLIIKANIHARVQYLKNFIISALLILPYQFVSLVVLWGVFSSFRNMKGWTYEEVVFLGALLNIVTGLANGFFKQFRLLENYIIDGSLDIYLTRPKSVLFQVSVQEIDLLSLVGQVLPNILILIMCIKKISIQWSIMKIIVLLESILFGTMFFACLFLCIGSLGFWFYRTNNVCMTVVYSVQDFVQYPLNIYENKMKNFLTYFFPLALINYYPLQCLKGTSEIKIQIFFGVGAIAMLGISLCLWKYGLHKYQGTGS